MIAIFWTFQLSMGRWWTWRQKFVKNPLDDLVQKEDGIGDEMLEEVLEPHGEQLQRPEAERERAVQKRCG